MSDQNTEWLNTLPEEVRTWDEAKTAPNPEHFWKQIKDHRSRLGRSLTVPTAEASAEERAAFNDKLIRLAPGVMPRPNPEDADAVKSVFKALGLPEDANGYELPEIPGLTLDETRAAYLKGIGLKHNLTKAQLKGLAEDLLTPEVESSKAAQAAADADRAQLKGEWGAAYQERLDIVAAFAERTNAPATFIQNAKEGKISSEMARWMYAAAKAIPPEGTPGASNAGPQPGKPTPSEARQMIDEIRRNKEHPFNNPNHRDNQEWVTKRMPALYEMALA